VFFETARSSFPAVIRVMDATRSSLLLRLRDPDDSVSWSEFYRVYEPFLRNIARKLGLRDQDLDDVVSEVLMTCVKTLPTFEKDRDRGFFRSWLKTVTRNRIHDLWRKGRREGAAPLDQAAEPAAEDNLWEAWDREYRQTILDFALAAVREGSQTKTWGCFDKHILQRRSAAEVAAELGLQVNAVYANASRVLKRVREKCAEYDEDLVDA
jgi:RNA polymerase sigma-70 factor (ECF subfamily)